MSNGTGEHVWKPLALSLMTALLVFATTTWTMWPRDIATSGDVMALRDDINNARDSIQRLAIELAAQIERVRLLQEGRNR